VLLPVQVPWGSSDDQQETIVLELLSEEVVGSPRPNHKERVIFIMSYFHFLLFFILITRCGHSYIFRFTCYKLRVKKLKKELERPSEHGKRIMSRLVCFLRKERGGQEGGGSRGSGLSLE
jgi:hypothetical protein